MKSTKPAEITIEDLQRACQEWQRRLRLQDWDVEVFISRRQVLRFNDTAGECWSNTQHKKAQIHISHPDDHNPSEDLPRDPENTLVHELLHLHFDAFSAKLGTTANTAQEQAINLIAGGLLELGRILPAPSS